MALALYLSFNHLFIQQTLIPLVLELWQVSEFPGGFIKTVFWALLPDFFSQWA